MLCILLIFAGIIQILCFILNASDGRHNKAMFNALLIIVFFTLAGRVA